MGGKMALSKIGLGLDNKSKRISKKSKKQKIAKKKRSKKTASNTKTAKPQKSVAFSTIVKAAKTGIKKSKGKSLKNIIAAAVQSAKRMKQGNNVKKVARILKVPKFGGSIEKVLPFLSGLSAVGSITASALDIAKTLKAVENAKKQFGVEKTSGEKKIGKGISLIYKGSGFYLKPSPKNC